MSSGSFLPVRLAALVIAGAALFAPGLALAQAPPAVPALPDSERRTSYSLSSSTCAACSVGFALYGDSTDYGSWIEVWIITGSGTSQVATRLLAVTDYTLSSATGSLSTIPRPITDATITLTTARTGTLQIIGARRPRRTTQFAENRGVAARDLNQVITDLVATQRETWDRTNDVAGRALLTPPGDTVGQLPVAAVRAGGVLAFDGSGNPTITAALTGLGNVVGPNVSVVGHIPVFANTSGTLLSDGGLIGTGDVVGPASSTADHAVTFSNTTGKLVKDSGLTLTASTGTFTLTNAKTFAVTNTLTLSGTDSTVMTFPTTSATIARTDAANTFTGHQTIEGVTSTGATGTGKFVFDTSPTLSSPTFTTPTLGAATATTINKVTITAPATGSTLTIADGKTATHNASTTFAGTDGKTLTVNSSLTLGGTDGKTLTVSNSGTLAGGDAFTLAIAAGKTLTASNSLTLAGTDGTTITFQGTDTYVGRTTTDTLTNKTLTAPTINGGTAQALTNLGIRSTGTGAFDLVFANTENLTAQRTLTLTLNNAARTISLSGNLSFSAGFTTSGSGAITFNTSGATSVTLPTAGTLATIDQAQTFSSSNIFSAVTQFTDIKLSSGHIYPTGDSTTALQITKADGTTRVVDFDTTNARVGINKTPGAFDLDVSGAVNVDGAITFGVGTITGLTVNNSPSSSNDYLLYYNASANAIRRCTVGSCAAAATAGVSSLNGLTGGITIAAGDGVAVSASGTTVTVNAAGVPQGRLTLATGTPVVSSTQSAKTTIYYDCYVGRYVPIYNGTSAIAVPISGCEYAMGLDSGVPRVASGSVYDIFAVVSSGNVATCIGPAWTSTTARGTGAGTTQIHYNTSLGFYTNQNALTNCYGGAAGTTNFGSVSADQGTYLGTFYATANGQTSFVFGAAATAGNFNLWNMYNRVLVPSITTDNSGGYTYTSSTIRQAHGSTNYQVQAIIGLVEDGIEASFSNTSTTVAAANAQNNFGVGLNSTTAYACSKMGVFAATAVATSGSATAVCSLLPRLGLNTVSANEAGDGTNANSMNGFNDNSLNVLLRM